MRPLLSLATAAVLSRPALRLSAMALSAVALSAAPASALPLFVYLPNAELGAYLPELLPNTDTTPAARAAAALTRLKAALPELSALTVQYQGNTATLTIDPARQLDPAVADTALGAAYHTLAALGFAPIQLGSTPLTPSAFSRPALVSLAPLPAALATTVTGWVLVAGQPIPAATFYTRLAAQDRDLEAAAKAMLETGTPDTRLQLVTHIDALKSKNQEALLLDRLSDPDVRVRKAAVARLAKAPSAQVQKALASLVDRDTDTGIRLDAAKILVASGKKEFDRYLLLDKLQASDSQTVTTAAKSLASSKDPKFIPAIAGLAAHADPAIRTLAVSLLKDLAATGLLAGIAADPALNPDVRGQAARTLAALPAVPATDRVRALAWLITSGPEAEALTAIQAARTESLVPATPALATALTRPEAPVRAAAAQALGSLHDQASLAPLAAALQATQDAAERALFEREAEVVVRAQPLDQALTWASGTEPVARAVALRALATFAKEKPNPKITDVLKRALSERDPATRRAAAFALATTADDAIANDLAKLVADPDAEIRAQVLNALGRTKGSAQDALIVKALDDNEASVRVAALLAVQNKRLAAAYDKVRFLTANRTTEVRREAARALVILAKPVDPQLFDTYSKLVQDEDGQVKSAALDGLAPYNDARAAQYLGFPLLDDRSPVDVKVKALGLLAKLTVPDAVEHVIRGLFDADRAVKLATLDALAQLKSEKSQRPLQEFVLGETDAELKARANAVLDVL